jgi:apolipoprotein N-acyltransferase
VGVVQANIDQGIKWDLDYFWQTMDDHLALTRELMKSNPKLIIWPEAAVTAPGGFNKNWELRTRVILSLSEINTYLLAGGLTVVDCDNPAGERSRCAKNSVYLLTPHAENLSGRYDKIHLVPFGEYIPMAKILFFADAIARGNTGSTTAGTEIKVLSVPGAHFGCVICYEVIFPELVRKFPREGAGFMTTVTNDAWFGKTGAPYQHNSNAVFRAVENRVYFVRSANTGVSSLVDPVGKIIHQSDLYVPAAFIGEVQASPLKTFYTRAGDVFAMADAAALLVWLAAGIYLRRAAAAA